MELFHWRITERQGEYYDYFIMSENLQHAREVILQNIKGWTWQNPKRFQSHAKLVAETNPYFSCEENHVITIPSDLSNYYDKKDNTHIDYR